MIYSRMVAAGAKGFSAAEENVIFERVKEWAKYQIAHPQHISDVEAVEKQQAKEELQMCSDNISTLLPVSAPALGEDTVLACPSGSLDPSPDTTLAFNDVCEIAPPETSLFPDDLARPDYKELELDEG